MDEKGFRELDDGRIEIEVRFLTPGTVLAWPTFDVVGNLVHLAYRPYTKEDLAELLASNNNCIYYTQKVAPRAQYEKDLKSYLEQGAYQGPRTVSLDAQRKAVSAMSEIVQFIKNGMVTDFHQAREIVEYVLNDIHTSKEGIINLLDIQNFDDYTYTHSLNVGVIAMVLAKRMGLSDAIMFNVGLAGFLHDIGKLRIPQEIVNKPGRLTPEEFQAIRQHPRLGYDMVRQSDQINDTVKHLILFHHERADGSGYPLGLTLQKLGNLPFLIAVADFYDALTTDRSYKRALPPAEALKIIMKQSVTHFPEKIVQRFMIDMKDLLKESNFYEIDMYVLLNTQEVGRVVAKDNLTTTRPTIEILRNSRGEVNKKPVRVDLNYDGSRSIIKILEGEEVENLRILFPK